jgi:ABC-type phosphate transport system ATPase subunit
MTDTSHEALDALDRCRAAVAMPVGVAQRPLDIAAEVEKRVAALRAAPVAMRERAAQVALEQAALSKKHADQADEVGHDTTADQMRMEAEVASAIAQAIRALPLDAPAPAVDPVAEARIAAFLKDRDDALGVTEYHTDEERAESARIIATLAQETHHD